MVSNKELEVCENGLEKQRQDRELKKIILSS